MLPVLLAGLAMGLVIRLGLPDAGRLLAEDRRARRRRFVFLGELVAARETVRASGDPRQWTDRLRPDSADYAVAGLALHRHQAWRALVLAALAAGGVAGAVAAAPAAPGALLVAGWLAARSLLPLLALAGAALPAVEAGQALGLLDRLMRLAPEGAGADPTRPRPRLAGRLTLRGVVYGYHPDGDPALTGIDLDVPPGQVVAVLGADGAGKSTLLRLIAGLGSAQAGIVAVDGQDVRRLDPRTLRQILSYLPPTSDLFHGTVAQNLRLADPLAGDERLVHAAAEAGVLSAIMSLPAGFETKLGDVDPARIPPGFARGLALARALVRETPILLLDEPGRALDEPGDEALIERLGALRGRATVLLVTHRPAHVRAADRAIVLEEGSIVFDGAPAAALHRLG